MTSSEPAVRYKHVSLPTQQRRLRHLHMIAVRNIGQAHSDGSPLDISNLKTFFTLHKNCKDEAFYTSERIKGSVNPTWRSFNLDTFPDSVTSLTSKFCVVRVWRVLDDDDDVKLCIEWFVHLDGLVYLGDKSQQERLQYPPNTVLFGILDGIYGCPGTVQTWDLSNSHILLEQAAVRESYSTQTLLRIKTILRAIQQTRASVRKVKRAIEERLHRSNGLHDKRTERELHALKTYSMRRDLDWRLRALRSEKENFEDLQSTNNSIENDLESKFLMLHRNKTALHEKKKGYFNVREDLIKTGAQLVMRRKQLISELAFIYPIVEVSNHKDFTICGVKLPNSEDFLGQDEIMIAVALGYTCHLVVMISHFLDIPMRYPMEHQGSRSTIRDHIIDKLTDKERDFPLYSKGKEKFQFNYGVYLLNKNIAQLRYYCALGTTDLRMTLPNLKSLLEFRLGVKFESTNAPVLAGQHMAVPPNLGGPQNMLPSSLAQLQNNSVPAQTRGGTSVQRTPHDSEDTAECKTLKTPEGPKADGITELTDSMAEPKVSDPNGDIRCPWAGDDLHSVENSLHVSNTVDAGDGVSMHSKDELPLVGSPMSASPVIKTLDLISREKLMGSIANYDDLDVSSSEDSTYTNYASRFKMWPRDQLDISLIDSHWSGEDVGISDHKVKDGTLSSGEPTSTFKTKAMTSPSRGTTENKSQSDCSDLLTVAEQWQEVAMAPSNTFCRQRTDSSTDGEDAATFVIPKAKQIEEVSALVDRS